MDLLAVFAVLLFVSLAVESWDLVAETNYSSEQDNLHTLRGDANTNPLKPDAKNQVDRELAGGIERLERKNETHRRTRGDAENDNPGMCSSDTRRCFTRRVVDIEARMSNYVRRLTCDRPHFPDPGTISSTGSPHGVHFRVGRKIQYRCERGYVLRGTLWNKCVHFNGNPYWYLPMPTCQRELISKVHLSV